MNHKAFQEVKSVHILGIGGIGASALARLFFHEGKRVSGQDIVLSSVTEELKHGGITISKGQKLSKIPKGADLIIYSSALSKHSPEFVRRLKQLGIPMLLYSEALGRFSKDRYTIAVSGTHGKTTAVAMTARVLSDAGLSPTVIVGSILKRERSNFIAGTGKYLVVEADDYRRQFLELSPRILVITNIGEDHLDYYKDFADIQSAFAELALKVPSNGYIIADTSDKAVREVLGKAIARVVDYGEFLKEKIKLSFPGKHNQENAACALAVAHILGVPKQTALKALEKFDGTWRRFDFRGKTARGALVYDDYAHNPDKVRAAIAGFKEAHPKHRLIVVFQPHLYSRTKTLLKGFSSAFDGADEVLIAPIFAAREKADKSISSEILADAIQTENPKKPVRYIEQIRYVEKNLRATAKRGDVIVTMGAGDIYKLAEALINRKK